MPTALPVATTKNNPTSSHSRTDAPGSRGPTDKLGGIAAVVLTRQHGTRLKPGRNITAGWGSNRNIFKPNKNGSVAVGPGNGKTRTLFLFARCRCDVARKARRYSARCNSTAAATADGAAITQCTD